MPPARFAALIAVVLAAATLTVGLASWAAPAGPGPVWMLLPLLAAAASLYWRRRS